MPIGKLIEISETCTCCLPALQIWMCFDKSLQPIDCEIPEEEAKACHELSFNPIPCEWPLLP